MIFREKNCELHPALSVAQGTSRRQNLIKTSGNAAWTVGPMSNWLFSDTPNEDLAKNQAPHASSWWC